MISTRCSQVHSGFSWGLWKLLCGAAAQGLGRVPFVPQKPQTRLYLYMTKINQSTQLKVSSCLVRLLHPSGPLGSSLQPAHVPQFPISYNNGTTSARWLLVTKQWEPLWHAGISPCHRTASQSSPKRTGIKSPAPSLPGCEQQPPGSAFCFFFMGCLFLRRLGTEPKHSPCPPTSVSRSCTRCLLLNLTLLNTMCLILITCPSPMKVIEI